MYKSKYFQQMRDIVSQVANKYGRAYYLKENLLDSSTRFKVEHVLEKTYDGKMSNLQSRIDATYAYSIKMINYLNYLCKLHNVTAVDDPKKLIELLLDKNRRAFYRKRIDFYEKRDQLISFADLEHEWRDK